MSKMIPRETIDVLRQFGDVTVNLYGITATIYVPTNYTTVEKYQVYAEPTDFTYDVYTGNVWIEWSPNAKRLRSLGIYTEDELPILSRFSRFYTNSLGAKQEVNIVRNTYIEVPIEFVPDKYSHTDRFEVVDTLIGKVHDAVTNKLFQLAPKRTR